MAAPIRVDGLDAEEADDLVQALAARGLVAHRSRTDGEWQVEVREAHEQTERLLAEVEAALQLWLEEHDRSDVTLSVAGDPGTGSLELHAALRRRISRRASRQRPRS